MNQRFLRLERALEDEKSTSGRQKLLKLIYAFKLRHKATTSEELHNLSNDRLSNAATRRSAAG